MVAAPELDEPSMSASMVTGLLSLLAGTAA
jgi:hypothetical protein